MNKPIKIAFLLDFFPFPEDTDGRTKIIANIIFRLSESFDITVIYIDPEKKYYEESTKEINLVHYPIQISPSQEKLNKKEFLPINAISHVQIEKLINDQALSTYDIIHCALHSFPRLKLDKTRVFYGANDSLSLACLNGSIKGKLKYLYYRKVERKLSKLNFTYCLVSKRDALQFSPAKTLVLSNGIDAEKFSPSETEPVPNSIVFHGVLDYQVNLDAIKNMSQMLKRAGAKLELNLVGRFNRKDKHETQAYIQSFENCKLIGPVANIAQTLPGFQFYLALMSSGTGLKNKVLEAMSCGLIVLVNARAIEGMAKQEELKSAVYLISSPSDIKKALADTQNWSQKKLSARQYVIHNYSWSNYMNTLEKAYIFGLNEVNE